MKIEDQITALKRTLTAPDTVSAATLNELVRLRALLYYEFYGDIDRMSVKLTNDVVDRVDALYESTPCHDLGPTDRMQREIVAVHRLKRDLGGIEHYRRQAEDRALRTGSEWSYWLNLFGSQVNLRRAR